MENQSTIKNQGDTAAKNKKMSSQELFLQGYRQYPRPAWKKRLLLGTFIIMGIHWAIGFTDFYSKLSQNQMIATWGFVVALIIFAGIIQLKTPKCPVCKIKMKKLVPPLSDLDTTFKFYCEKCRIWMNTSRRHQDND